MDIPVCPMSSGDIEPMTRPSEVRQIPPTVTRKSRPQQLGGMAACLAITTEYAKIRAAFGRPIGAFQRVKHRLAELHTTWELAHAALRDAARAADDRPADFPRAAAVARIAVSASYVDAAIATIQLHGGIGFTWEHDAHLFHKNAISQHALFGGPGEQLDRLAGLLAAG